MNNFLNKHIKLLAIVWFLLNIAGLTYVSLISPPKFEADILGLISKQESPAHTDVDISPILGQELLKKNSKDIKFGFENLDEKSISKFKANLESEIPELATFNHFSKDEFKQLISNLWPYSLDSETLDLFKNNDVSAVTARIEKLLNSQDSIFYSNFLESDPLLLVAPKIKPILEGFHSDSSNKIARYTFNSHLGITDLDQKELTTKINTLVAKHNAGFKSKNPTAKIHWSGFLKFKDSSAKKIKHDLTLVSTASAILIPLFIILFFRSFWAPALSMVSGLSGVLFGILLVVATKDSIHLITLAFGSSLIGASIDYAIHYQSEGIANWRFTQDALRRLAVPALLVGAFTSILSFAGLYLSSFPGLQELAIFSIGSLFASLISTILWYPYLSFKNTEYRHNKIKDILNGFNVSKAKAIAALFLGLLIMTAGLKFDSNKPLFQDDIGALQSPDQRLVDEELWFKGVEGSKEYSTIVFISGKSNEDEIDNLLRLSKALDIKPLSALPDTEEAYNIKEICDKFIKEKDKELRTGLGSIGYNKLLIDKVFTVKNSNFQEVIEPLVDRFRLNDQYLFLPTNKSIHETSGEIQESGLEVPYSLYNHRDKISQMFKSFRVESIYLVSYSYLLIFTLLVYRYGLKKGVFSILPSLISVLCSLLILNILNIPLSFFGILALVIVLGLSIDYCVFYLESEDEDFGARLSIFLSTLTTIITFGALSFSETDSLRNFGIVISLGVFFTAMYTNILFSNANISGKTTKDKNE